MNTDFILSVGPACRPAWHLKCNNLRFFSSPFDWMARTKLETILYFIEQQNLNGFFQNREYLNKNRKTTKVVRDKTFNIDSLHDFPRSMKMADYYPLFMEKMNRRFSRILMAFQKFNHITFLSYGRDVEEIKHFLLGFDSIYKNKKLVFINVEHNSSLSGIEKHLESVTPNISIQHVSFNDVHPNGNTRQNPYKWRGNVECWNTICSDIVINNPQFLDELGGEED